MVEVDRKAAETTPAAEETVKTESKSAEAKPAEKTVTTETKPAEETVKTETKDKVIFITEEELSAPSKVTLDPSADEDSPPGLILPNGDINWNCPCLGGMAVGPCGVEFRAAFSCFHHSSADPKGSDCIEKFADMQICMQQYPELYDKKEIDKDSLDSEESSPEQSSEESSPEQPSEESSAASPEPTPVAVAENSVTESSETPAKTESESADLPPPPEPSSQESSPESSRAPSPALSI